MTIGLTDLQWDQVPAVVVDYIRGHPGTTIWQLLWLLILLIPCLIATPGLLALGFGAQGPIAGK